MSGTAWGGGVNAAASYYYRDKFFPQMAVKVLPGEYFVTDQDIMIVTLLGSCVAACIRDPFLKVGGLNHFLLPDTAVDSGAESARYGSYAMELLINELLKLGAIRSRLEAKVFGGANVVEGMPSSRVGDRNAQFVHDYLQRERIQVLSEDLGEAYPRRVHYFPATGRALVKRLPVVKRSKLLEEESQLLESVTKAPVAGEIELFD